MTIVAKNMGYYDGSADARAGSASIAPVLPEGDYLKGYLAGYADVTAELLGGMP